MGIARRVGTGGGRDLRHWREPGSGIWEVRGQPKAYLYGKLMCWAALDRGLRIAEHHHLEAPVEDWRRTCDEIRSAIVDKGFNREIGAFTQAFGHARLDATALTIPRIGFLPPTDARVSSTVKPSGSSMRWHSLDASTKPRAVPACHA